MLTGDKVETATCIAISTCIKHKSNKMFFMRDIKDLKEVGQKLTDYEKMSETVLFIDGTTLETVLSDIETEKRFFKSTTLGPAVCVCRCSPT